MHLSLESKNHTLKARSWSRANILVLVLLLLGGVFYVLNTWSPSSYGIVLNLIGAEHAGLVRGSPQSIRSDEFAVVTPLTQATVNNHFERYNQASLYQEDLRINYGLPIHDWGMIFKPSMWLYGVVNPAYAYSFHWFVLTALFIVGYAWLLRWFGATPVLAFTLAVGLYFTGMVQFWWSEKAPIFALFPWVLLPFATRWPLYLKALLFYWLAVVWLLTNFYPPIQVSLAFVGAIILLARAPELLRPKSAALLAVAALLAALTVAFYLGDYLRETASTVYPGARRSGGGGLDVLLAASWLFPTLNFDVRYAPVAANICEIGTVGMYYTLMVLFFLDYRHWRVLVQEKISLFALLGGTALLLAWMLLPLPWWAGAPLLWHYVPTPRMQFASGVMLLILMFYLAARLGLRLTWGRMAGLVAALGLGVLLAQMKSMPSDWHDWIAFLVVLLAFWFGRRMPDKAHAALATASLVMGVLVFVRFNPTQQAWPIFNLPETSVMRALDVMQATNQGVLVASGFPGASANGLGYRSLSHVLAVPKLAFWREHFPDLPQDELNVLFNRYAHVIPNFDLTSKLLQADAVFVPATAFIAESNVRYIHRPYATTARAGMIDSAELDRNTLVLSGWAVWRGGMGAQTLEVLSEPAPAGDAKRMVVLRPDVARALQSDALMVNGFKLRIPFQGALSEKPAICVYFLEKPGDIPSLLQNPPDLPYCQSSESVVE